MEKDVIDQLFWLFGVAYKKQEAEWKQAFIDAANNFYKEQYLTEWDNIEPEMIEDINDPPKKPVWITVEIDTPEDLKIAVIEAIELGGIDPFIAGQVKTFINKLAEALE